MGRTQEDRLLSDECSAVCPFGNKSGALIRTYAHMSLGMKQLNILNEGTEGLCA